jgi:hypothetical protein
MERKEHLRVDEFFYNKTYNEVHQWLDATYVNYMKTNPYLHWIERHHIKAIEEKYGIGSIEYNVAYLHILADFLSHLQIATVPKDEEDVKSYLKSWGLL